MPASEACADAINLLHERNDCNQRTNASYEFRRARSLCNIYESLGAAPPKSSGRKRWREKQVDNSGVNQFVNRSALKLANIDALMGFTLVQKCFSAPSSLEKKNTARPQGDEFFTFVDLCGAPGGFSEYILYRHEHPVNNSTSKTGILNSNAVRRCFGFGMSLGGFNEDGKGAHWDLKHLQRYHNNRRKSKNKMHYYICNGLDGTGNIYNWDNVLHLQQEVRSIIDKHKTNGESSTGLVNLVVADGGFDAQRDVSSQEEIAHRLIVSQTAAALHLLLPGGNFTIKMFGFQMERTRRLIQYLFEHFEKILCIKPIVSRPASAERYLVCLNFQGHGEGWDGLRWRDDMISYKHSTSIEEFDAKTVDDLETRLNNSLHLFDIQMLQLNIDSCRTIVQYLNKKRKIAAESLETAVFDDQKEDVDLSFYQQSWQLG